MDHSSADPHLMSFMLLSRHALKRLEICSRNYSQELVHCKHAAVEVSLCYSIPIVYRQFTYSVPANEPG